MLRAVRVEAPSEKQIIAFKIGARARKLAKEDCLIEGYELLMTGIAEADSTQDTEMATLLKNELAKYERLFVDSD